MEEQVGNSDLDGEEESTALLSGLFPEALDLVDLEGHLEWVRDRLEALFLKVRV